MGRIYLDNAATTPLDKEVLETMLPYMTTHFGNPSSIYSFGRETRLAVETARKSVAKILGAKPGEIFFTSGGNSYSNQGSELHTYYNFSNRAPCGVAYSRIL
jgi:cysteine desulfurase